MAIKASRVAVGRIETAGSAPDKRWEIRHVLGQGSSPLNFPGHCYSSGRMLDHEFCMKKANNFDLESFVFFVVEDRCDRLVSSLTPTMCVRTDVE